MKQKLNLIIRIIAFIVGFVLIGLGGITFTITTIPGTLLIVWSLTGAGLK
jgi:hypothetical protein